MASYVTGSSSLGPALDIIELRVISQLIQQDQGGRNSAESLAQLRNDVAQSLGSTSLPVPGDT